MTGMPSYPVRGCVALLLIVVAARPALAQKATDVTGTWRVDAGTDTKNGPREVIIRGDSSASWGKETVRWRVKDDRISIVLGGEWETYKIKVRDKALTLSGGDLQKAVTLRKVGPPTPRPTNARIPDDPDH
ncbi:MAG TPA: hypothetical protein VID74_05730 [Gemmatimonadales bacterium]|jgi:hypothetical protein